MINSIINKLKNDPTYGILFEHNKKLSYVMISTGNYRLYEKGRINFIIFIEDKPSFLIKFYKQPNDMLQKELDMHMLMFKKLHGKGISKPLGIVSLNNVEMMLEEAVVGKSLERYIYENSSMKSIQTIMQQVLSLYHGLNKTGELSLFDEFKKEVKLLIVKFTELYSPDSNELEIINECVSLFLVHFENEKIFKRFSNCDFVPRNLLVNDDLTLIDFEFAENTHLYFLDWFRFFKYQFALSNKVIYEMLHSEINDEYFISALRSFSNNYSDKFDLSCRLVFEIKDYVLRWSVTSNALRLEKKKEMQQIIAEISQHMYDNKRSQIIEKLSSNAAKSQDKTVYENLFKKTIDDLYREILNRPADEIGLQHYTSLLETGKITVADLRKTLLESDEYKTHVY